MVTLSDERGTIPPQVAGLFQSPDCTATNVDDADNVVAPDILDEIPVPTALIADIL
jgi:hypothetical protein